MIDGQPYLFCRLATSNRGPSTNFPTELNIARTKNLQQPSQPSLAQNYEAMRQFTVNLQ
jgi:hypothetical protein